MLFRSKDIHGFAIRTQNDEVGKVDQLYFDDEKWAIRYLVVSTGPWFSRSKILLCPLSIKDIDFENQNIITHLTREQILNSPDIDTKMPVSRQMETQYLDYYKWPYYWTGAGTWGTGKTTTGSFEIPASFIQSEEEVQTIPIEPGLQHLDDFSHLEDSQDSHLRSTQEVFGYHVDAKDAEFGRLEDLIIDQSNWAIRYLVIHLKTWLPSKSVLISKEWAESISWQQKKIRVSMSKNEIEKSPEFHPQTPLNRDYEELLHNHYAREKYWNRKKPKSAA